MGSEWAKEAERQAETLKEELARLGKGMRVSYQRREARFALKTATSTTYFSAHDYESKKGMDWRRLRADILVSAKQAGAVEENK